VSEWIGWVGRLRQMVYSRMEELSFRTGFAAVAGVLAVAATAILLTLTQGGHHAEPPRAQASLPPSSFVAAPAIVPFSTPATHRARRPEGGPDVRYAPEPTKAPIARPHRAPSPGQPTPRPSFPAPTYRPNPDPGATFSWPWPTPGSGFNGPGSGLPSAGPYARPPALPGST
jgi:hypothetical protein